MGQTYLVLKARHLPAYLPTCLLQKHNIGVPEEVLGWLPLGLGLVMEAEMNLLSFHVPNASKWAAAGSKFVYTEPSYQPRR